MDTLQDKTQDLLSTGNTVSLQQGLIPKVPALDNWPSAETKFLYAEEVEEMGKQLISRFRPDLSGLNIGYVFKDKASKTGENVVFGEAKPQSDLQKVLHEYDAIVLIGFDAWETLDIDGRYRLVYHELAHFQINPKSGKLSTVPHYVEEFPEVVRIFGLGKTADVDFIHAYQEFCKNNGR